jgi:hypothetical protein
LKSTFSRWLPAIARDLDSKNPFGCSFKSDKFSNVLPDFARASGRKAVLGVAGLAFVGAGVAGPTAAAFSGPQPAATPTTASAAARTAQDTMAPVAYTSSTPGDKALNYDYQRQPNFFYCGPAATRIALTTVGHSNSFDDVAKQLGTTESGTNSAQDTTRVLNSVVGGHVYTTHQISGATATPAEVDQLKNDVIAAVTNNHAVVANIAGTITDAAGNTHSYEGGHYLTIVGYGQGGTMVKIADPADPQGDGSYWVSTTTMANWIATRGYSA